MKTIYNERQTMARYWYSCPRAGTPNQADNLPALDHCFQVTPLQWDEMLLCAGLGIVIFLLLEVEKMWLRRR